MLASASPRRTELLASAGIPHEIVPSPAPEPPAGSLPPVEHVRASALAKARAVADALPGRLVLGADTVVTLGEEPGAVLGKPRDDEDAARMLRLLSGRGHDVLTGLALCRDGAHAVRHARTRVVFGPLDDALIARYVATGEPRDKAGAYAVQGRLALHVARLEGSWSNVVGLPLEELARLFEDAGERLQAWQDW